MSRHLLNTKIYLIQMVIAISVPLWLSGCDKSICIPVTGCTALFNVSQTIPTTTQSARFYVCGNSEYPCKTPTSRGQKICNKSKSEITKSKEQYDEKDNIKHLYK